MDEFLRRLARVHRRDIPAAPEAQQPASPPGQLLDYLVSSTAAAVTAGPPDYYQANLSLANGTDASGAPAATSPSFPLLLDDGAGPGGDGHVRSNESSFPLSSFAVIKAAVLAIVLGILLLTSCRVVGKMLCKKSSKEESQ